MVSGGLIQNSEWVLEQRKALVTSATPLRTSVGAETPEAAELEPLVASTYDRATQEEATNGLCSDRVVIIQRLRFF